MEWSATSTDENGEYVILLPSGTWLLSAASSYYSGYDNDLPSQIVQTNVDETVDNVDFIVASASSRINAKLILDDVPATGMTGLAFIESDPTVDQRFAYVYRSAPIQDGEFSLPIFEGSYLIELHLDSDNSLVGPRNFKVTVGRDDVVDIEIPVEVTNESSMGCVCCSIRR